MITFEIEWSWFAFTVGVLATLFLEFWLLVVLAYRQWNKQRKLDASTTSEEDKNFYALIEEWNKNQK
jgi:hypothetical protein